MNFIPLEYTYAALPTEFYQSLGPREILQPRLKYWNESLAQEMGLDRSQFTDEELAFQLSAVKLGPGAKPIAMAYSGHQFGHFNPNMGDGRALLLGEFRNRKNQLIDLHLKGSGKTQFSRRGDGLANAAAVIREYIVGEGLYHLGIPTSRALALIETESKVQRETIQPSYILVRTALGHIRVGSFEHFISRGRPDLARTLARYTIQRLYPDILVLSMDEMEQSIELFDQICRRQARLVAKWLAAGFVHGVMNTDNTFLSGETLDLGPCAFLEEFDSGAVFSSIDENGRYAYSRQPEILKWNLSLLGSCFLNFIEGDENHIRAKLEASLSNFDRAVQSEVEINFTEKIGFFKSDVGNKSKHYGLAQEFLALLQKFKADMTLAFRSLADVLDDSTPVTAKLQNFWAQEEVISWKSKWMTELKAYHQKTDFVTDDLSSLGESGTLKIRNVLKSMNPLFIPRNHQVEKSIQHVLQNSDWTYMTEFLKALHEPFKDANQENMKFSSPANESEKITATFCNT